MTSILFFEIRQGAAVYPEARLAARSGQRRSDSHRNWASEGTRPDGMTMSFAMVDH